MLPSCSTSADRVALLCRPSPKLGELAARGEVIHENRDENHDGATEERGHEDVEPLQILDLATACEVDD